MPSIKNLKKVVIGKKGQFDTHTTEPQVRKGAGPKGFDMGNPSSPTQGVGRKPSAGGKAMGTRKGGGGRSY